jgi:hypothetical protein
MRFLRVRLLAFAVALAGCQPGIGDECETSTDCSANGDRLCDITQPGGYCTIFNCEPKGQPKGCPDDSVCVAFAADRSSVPGCEEASGASPFQRAFCMANCDSDEDCRKNYACMNLKTAGNDFGAVVIDKGSGKVCVFPYSSAPIPDDRSNEVCTGSDVPAELPPSSAAGGAGSEPEGQGGAAGAADESSAGAGGA